LLRYSGGRGISPSRCREAFNARITKFRFHDAAHP
jgi:hypothetical protein